MTQPTLTLLIGLAGVGAAWLYLAVGWWAPLAPAIVLALLGLGADRIGQNKIRRDPVGALPWLEGWVLLPGAIAGVAAGAVLVITILLTPGESTARPQRDLITQAVTLLTAFLLAIAVKQMDDADQLVSGHIKKIFSAALGPLIPAADEEARRALYAPQFTHEAQGWGRDARRIRARALARGLRALA